MVVPASSAQFEASPKENGFDLLRSQLRHRFLLRNCLLQHRYLVPFWRGAKTDRAQLRRLLDHLEATDVLTVTRLDRLALLNTFATITAKKAGFKSLGNTWADTTTSQGA